MRRRRSPARCRPGGHSRKRRAPCCDSSTPASTKRALPPKCSACFRTRAWSTTSRWTCARSLWSSPWPAGRKQRRNMREALHIFRKDVRALWAQILIALAAASLPVLVRDPQQSDRLIGVLVLARWFLVVSAVHQEKLVGDREWWLTRPNSWKSLLTAKLLLIAAFVQIPLLFSDLAILTSDGLQIAWGRLAARQIQLAIALVLPAAAVAAITPGLASFGLAVLAIWIAI